MCWPGPAQSVAARCMSATKHFDALKCDFAIWKTISGRMLERAEAEQLITAKEVGPLQGFPSKKGRPFTAALKMTVDCKVTFDFGRNGSDSG
jgi:DNA topoisomerase III